MICKRYINGIAFSYVIKLESITRHSESPRIQEDTKFLCVLTHKSYTLPYSKLKIYHRAAGTKLIQHSSKIYSYTYPLLHTILSWTKGTKISQQDQQASIISSYLSSTFGQDYDCFQLFNCNNSIINDLKSFKKKAGSPILGKYYVSSLTITITTGVDDYTQA